jgi:hypothetical protein
MAQGHTAPLVNEILVHRDEDFKMRIGGGEELAVAQAVPVHLARGLDFVPAQRPGQALVEEDFHRAAWASSSRASSNPRMACSCLSAVQSGFKLRVVKAAESAENGSHFNRPCATNKALHFTI